jgi:hypothetical protein
VTFLSPTPALIAAALTVPALLLLYFLKLRRRPLRISSTLLWEQAVRDLQVNVPFRLLRFTALLLLQLLILASFLLALARPALHAKADAAPRIVLLIDRSASMSAQDGPNKTTRLEAAKQSAGAFLDDLSRSAGSPAVAVVAFAAQPEALTSLSPDTGAARAAINSVTPTDQPGDLAAALRLASTIVAGDTDESAARTRALVVLFSDGGFPPDGLTLSGADFRFERQGSSPDADRDNLGIVALAARRDWDDPGTVRIFTRIQNSGITQVTAPAVLTLDGKEVERRAIAVPGRIPVSPVAGNSPPSPINPVLSTPGEASATFVLPTRDGGVAELAIDRPDLLAADNRAALIIAPATKPRILIVVPDPSSPDPSRRGPEWVVTDLVDEMALPMRVRTASSYANTAPADLHADLIIFDRVRPSAAPLVPSISFGAGLPVPGLDAGPATDQGTYVIAWDRSSPILRHVALDTLYIAHPLALTSPEPGSGTTELARGVNGPLLLVAQRGSTRHLVVGFELAQSNWPLQVGFPIFMAAAIDDLTLRADDRAGRAFTTAEPVRIEGVSGTVALDGPRRITAEVPAGAPAANFGRIETAGVYRVQGAGASGSIAVNLLDANESDLQVRDSVRVAGTDVAAVAPGQGPRELWPYLVLIALVLLTIEWFVNAWLMRA